jgi:hypothetical protein
MRRAWIGLPISVVVGLTLSLFGSTVASASASASAGTAVITKPGQEVPLDSGGSTTPYGFWLPDDARCSGDTQHDEYHIFSFMFPKGVSPTGVSFKTGEAAGLGTNGRLGFVADGQYVGAINTAPTTGQVVGLPESYTWTRLTPKYLLLTGGKRTSAWEGGILCANKFGVVTNYWDTAIVFTASKTDVGGFTWRVPKSAQDAIVTGHSFPIGIVFVIVAVALAAVAVVMGRRRRIERDNGSEASAKSTSGPGLHDRPQAHSGAGMEST